MQELSSFNSIMSSANNEVRDRKSFILTWKIMLFDKLFFGIHDKREKSSDTKSDTGK